MLTSYILGKPAASRAALEGTIPDIQELLWNGKTVQLSDQEPAIVRTHFLPSTGVMQLYRDHPTKILYLVRNPRDVLMSNARQHQIELAEDERSRKFVMDFIAKGGLTSWIETGMGSWPQHVLEWTSAAQEYFPDSQLCVVRYEDLKADTFGKLEEVLKFLDLDVPVDSERVRRLAENSSIEKMREIERSFRSETAGVRQRRFARSGGHPVEFVGQGLSDQSFAVFGEDVEAAYKQAISDGGNFAEAVNRFGYQ